MEKKKGLVSNLTNPGRDQVGDEKKKKRRKLAAAAAGDKAHNQRASYASVDSAGADVKSDVGTDLATDTPRNGEKKIGEN